MEKKEEIQVPVVKAKSKLLDLLNHGNKGKKKKQAIKITNDKSDIDPSKFKTKPTKPDFSSQFIESGLVGLKVGKSSTQYKGLTNYGNVCYSNVVMQCLIALSEFVGMLNNIYSKIEDFDENEKNFPFLCNLVKIQNYYKIKNTALASGHLKLIVNMFDSSGEQNDAHEFLVFIFDRLNDEIIKMSKLLKIEFNINQSSSQEETEWEEVKKGGKRMKQVNTAKSFETSIIGNIFQGILKHELESKGNSLSKCNIEPFFVLSLDYGENSLISCFDKFFSKRKIEHETAPIFQKSYIEKLPKVLIVHLKAFYYDKNIHKIIKINKEIIYETTLTLDEKYIAPGMQSLYKNVEYELVSVIIHKGTKASEGHYICFCKDSNGIWWNLDDKNVHKIDETVLENFRPYILFYRMV